MKTNTIKQNEQALVHEFAENFKSLQRCETIYNKISWLYIAMPLMNLFFGIVIMVGASYDALFVLIMQLLIYPFVGYHGWMSCYKKNDFSAMSAPTAIAINCIVLLVGSFLVEGKIFGRVPFNSVLFALIPNVISLAASGFSCVLTLRANAKYRWLEQQVGFPYFNERNEEHKMDMRQFDIIDPYQVEINRLKKTAREDMPDMESPSQSTELEQKVFHADSGNMPDL
ncbi:MAG: hypothetical protein II690_05415 [Ruminococcus sp.]|nr:hypothetical protein [Ruminococcus sp.]